MSGRVVAMLMGVALVISPVGAAAQEQPPGAPAAPAKAPDTVKPAQQPQPAAAAPPAAEPVAAAPRNLAADYGAKLAALTPNKPEGYFLLAEEVADETPTPEQEALARTLYVLAFELDRRPGHAGTLAPSAALGLARVERLERDRRWLVALAAAIDRRYALPDWTVPAGGTITDDVAYQAATVLGLARSGEGREARKWLEKPGVADTLKKYERLIGDTGETGALARLAKYIDAWPCPQCHNERTVTVQGEHGPEKRLCPTCHGNPGPELSDDELIAQLRFEAALLNGIQRSWAAQVIVDQSAPLRDPDPEELAATYRVDPDKPYWRGGTWVAKADEP